MKLLISALVASCALQATARIHARDLLEYNQSDLCEYGPCTVDTGLSGEILVRRAGGAGGKGKVIPTDRDGPDGTTGRDNDRGDTSSGTGGIGTSGGGSRSSGEGSPSPGSQEEQVKATIAKLISKKDKNNHKFGDGDRKALDFLEGQKGKPDDKFDMTPDYTVEKLEERARKLLQRNGRSKEEQAKVDAKIKKNYVFEMASYSRQTRGKSFTDEDTDYIKLFTDRNIPKENIRRIYVHSESSTGKRTRYNAIADYYVDTDLKVMVCAKAFGVYDTNAFTKVGSKFQLKPSNDKAVQHSDLMWAMLAKVGGADTANKIKNLETVIQHDVINLGTLLTWFRVSQQKGLAATDKKSFKIAEHPVWAGTSNVSPTIHLAKDHPGIANGRQPSRVSLDFVDGENPQTYYGVLSVDFPKSGA